MIIDNFLPDIGIVKRHITDVEYGEHELLGKKYTGFGRVSLPVKALIEKTTGPISIRVCYLRKGGRDTPLTYNIHADRAVASHAFVLCINEPECESGTMFWRHKGTGLDALPVPTPLDVFAMLDADLHDESKWEQTEFVPSRENRALIFDSARFHSRWPKVIDSETPRIVCTAFFDLNADIEKLQALGGDQSTPPIIEGHMSLPAKNSAGNGILSWDRCANRRDVLECNAVNLSGTNIYLDHDRLTADVPKIGAWREACRFIASLGYNPEVSYG